MMNVSVKFLQVQYAISYTIYGNIFISLFVERDFITCIYRDVDELHIDGVSVGFSKAFDIIIINLTTHLIQVLEANLQT